MSQYNYVYDKVHGGIYLASTNKYLEEGEVYNRDVHKNYLAKRLYKYNLEDFFEEVVPLNLENPELDKSNLVYFNGKEQSYSIRKQLDSAMARFKDLRDHLMSMRKDLVDVQQKLGLLLRATFIMEAIFLITLLFSWENVGVLISMVLLGLGINPYLMYWTNRENDILKNKILKLDYTLMTFKQKEYVKDCMNEKPHDLVRLLQLYHSNIKVVISDESSEGKSVVVVEQEPEEIQQIKEMPSPENAQATQEAPQVKKTVIKNQTPPKKQN